MLPYGLWRPVEPKGICLLVEGESDCWALWNHNWPALGLPGAAGAGLLKQDHVADIGLFILHRERDEGGARFHQAVSGRLKELDWHGALRVFELPTSWKDPGVLHVDRAKTFNQILSGAIRRGTRSIA